MIILNKPDSSLVGVHAQDFYSDAVQVRAGNTWIQQFSANDTLPASMPYMKDMAHRDHIQIIPALPPYHNQQYAAHRLHNVAITQCRLW